MNITSLLADMAQADIRLFLKDEQLGFSAPEGAMTDARVQLLRQHKAELINFLSQSQQQISQTIPTANREHGVVLSSAQQRLWFLQQLEPKNSAYHIHSSVNIQGPLDIGLLNLACEKIIEKHEVLRTRYQMQQGQLRQFPEPALALNIRPEPIDTSELEAAINAEIATPFDLSQAQTLRVRLWQTGAQQFCLSFTIHHIGADGWSMGILMQDFVQFYQQQESPSPAVQYADFAAFEQQQDVSQSEGFWLKQLQNVPALNLPLDTPRHPLQSALGANEQITLSQQQLESLEQLAKQQGCTLFMLLITAYSLLLHKISNDCDFAIGTPVAGRSLSQVEQTIGCFINTLALRFELSPTQSFSEFLALQTKNIGQAFKHQDVPFENIVNKLDVPRDTLVTPVFQTLFVLQNTPFSEQKLEGLSITPRPAPQQAAQFDLSLSAQAYQGELVLNFQYKQSLFEAQHIKQLGKQFTELLTQICQNPDEKISQLHLISEQDANDNLRFYQQLNQTQQPWQLPETPLQAFEYFAQNSPNNLAISCQGQSLSYSELNQKANQLAHYLQSLGAHENTTIALHLAADTDFFIALLAVVKTGACYLPIDINYPLERCQQIIDSAQPLLIISDHLHYPGKTLALKQQLNNGLLNDQPTTNLAVAVNSQSPMYCIFTSGSTGKPKGVLVSKKSALHLWQWHSKHYQFNQSDKALVISSIGFDLTQKNLFAPLFSGASIHLPEPGPFNPIAINRLINDAAITQINCAPSVALSILQSQESRLPSLRLLQLGGEPIKQQLLEAMLDKTHSHCQLENMYGPTECTDISHCYTIKRELGANQSVFIGKPIQNVQFVLLDSKQKLAAQGQAGELYIGGEGVALGYIDQSLNSAFVKLSLLDGTPQRFYKTGDWARLNSEGFLQYIGRADEQVKIRGLRIELSDIEQQLNHLAGVNEAVVVVQQEKIIAYYQGETELQNQQLRQQLMQQLPQYMLPSAFVFIANWPLNASGKIDKRALPPVDFAALNAKNYVAPNTETQQQLAEIWQQVLGIERIGIEDNFFDLGGHSLTATQAFSLAQERFNVEIPLREIFQQPTIAYIASCIDQALLQQSVFSTANTLDDEEQESFTL